MTAEAFIRTAARRSQALLPLIGLSAAAATVFVVPRSTHALEGDALPTGSAMVAAGVALVLVGTLARLQAPASPRGQLAILAGLAVLAPEWMLWFGGPAIPRSLAMLAQPFALPLVTHLVLAEPSGRLAAPGARLAVRAAYAVATFAALGYALFRDPFLDPACPQDCGYNVFLVSAAPGVVRALDVVVVARALAIGVVIAASCTWRLVRATRTAVAVRAPIVVPGAVIGVEVVIGAALRIADGVPQPRSPAFAVLALVDALALLGLAAGSLLVLLRLRRTRSAVARLTAELGALAGQGTLASVLARATGDPSLDVIYPLPDGERYVDATGRSVEPPLATPGRAVTPVARRGQPVAFIVHDAAALDAEDIRRDVGAAARLAVENERLHAEYLAQLSDLRASRVRLVEAADDERRRLERDLHDGAQQRLLALGFDLRRAAAAAARGDRRAEQPLAAAIVSADEAIIALRDLAHGIYPAVLTASGIGAALLTLTDDSPVPLDILEVPMERFAEPVERAAFEVVTETVAEAGRVRSAGVAVRVARDRDNLVVEIDGTGEGPFTHLADRVGALGGQIVTHGSRLRADIPCAS